MRSITQRSLPSPDPLGVLRLAILGVMSLSRSALRCLRLSYARSASSVFGLNLP